MSEQQIEIPQGFPSTDRINAEIEVRANLAGGTDDATWEEHEAIVMEEISTALAEGRNPTESFVTPEPDGTEEEQPAESTYDILETPIQRAQVAFFMDLPDADSVGDALDMAAITLARFGIDNLRLLISEGDGSGRNWLVENGEVSTVDPVALDAATD